MQLSTHALLQCQSTSTGDKHYEKSSLSAISPSPCYTQAATVAKHGLLCVPCQTRDQLQSGGAGAAAEARQVSADCGSPACRQCCGPLFPLLLKRFPSPPPHHQPGPNCLPCSACQVELCLRVMSEGLRLRALPSDGNACIRVLPSGSCCMVLPQGLAFGSCLSGLALGLCLQLPGACIRVLPQGLASGSCLRVLPQGLASGALP